MRLQSFQLAGDTILDLLTDSLEAARLVELPVGVVAEGQLEDWNGQKIGERERERERVLSDNAAESIRCSHS